MGITDISRDLKPREVSFNDFHAIDQLLQNPEFSDAYEAMQDETYHSWVIPRLIEAGIELELEERGIKLPFAVVALIYHDQLRPICGFSYLMDIYESVLDQEPDSENVAHLVTALRESGQEAEHIGKLLRLRTPVQSFLDGQESTREMEVGARIYDSMVRYGLAERLFPVSESVSINLLD